MSHLISQVFSKNNIYNVNMRVSLMDPMLYQSTYINPNPQKPLKINFWKKFHLLNFLFNIAIPIIIFIFVLFVLKGKYLSKLQKKSVKINVDPNDQKNYFPYLKNIDNWNNNSIR